MKFFIFIFIFILSIPLLSKERDAVMLKIVSDLKVSKTTYNIFRSGAEIYMGVTYCGKGDALNELSRKYNFSLHQTLAIGDGDNDLSMLNGSSAKMIACVGNACSKLKEVVKQAGGYQEEGNDVKGVVESIKHFLNK